VGDQLAHPLSYIIAMDHSGQAEEAAWRVTADFEF